MADNKNPAKTPIYESQESLYEKAMKKMDAERLIIQFAYKIENYQVAASMFEEVGDYKDAPELARRCRELAEQTREEEKEAKYQTALLRKEKGSTKREYEIAKQLFEESGDYKAAKEECKECQNLLDALEKRKHSKTRKVVIVAVLLIFAVSAGFFSGFFHYVMAFGYSVAGYYKDAEEIFSELDGFLDSEKRAEGCRNKQAEMTAQNGRKALLKAKVGNELSYGTHTWKVLERNGDFVYLIATQVNSESEFYHVPFHDTLEEVTWETSSLRQWLNTEILENCFTEEERSHLVLMKTPASENTSYEMNGGMDTEDYVRILSAEEAKQYMDVLKTLGLDCWLRTPGNSEETSAYISASHSIMEYGYPVNDMKISVRPVITVDCSGLKLEE